MGKVLRVTVTKTDGSSVTLPVLPVTIVAFEREKSVGLGSPGATSWMSNVYWLAWHAEKIANPNKVSKLFDDWLPSVADVEAVEEVGPKETVPSPSSSLTSPPAPE
jgi:hypothetical protein